MFKKILVILCVGILAFAIYQVAFTYALFETNQTAKVDNDLATWDITLNGSQVTTLEHTFDITQFNWATSTHVASGKVAPGLSGYFDIVLDPGETDVSIRYDITFDFSEMTNEEFTVTQIEETVNNNLIRTGEFVYTGIITLAEIELETTHTIRTSLAWNNNEANNEVDYLMGSVAEGDIQIPIIVVVSQYLGETITAYQE
ncbi:MAG TPA: hypothetical protein PLT65_03035 [Bacilli bacterium]|nr:hypothetical protein [Bacilli bacterium]